MGGEGQELAQPGALPVADELLVLELGHSHCAAPGELMVARQDDHELLGDELMQAQPVALHALGDRQEGEVEHVVTEHLGQLFARLFAHGELDGGVALMEHGERQRDVHRSHGVHRADRHVPRPHTGERLHLGVGGVDLGEDPAGARHQRAARFGDRDPAGRALDERQSDFPLEPADLLREGGLGDVLARGGAGEVLLVGERDEVAQLAKFHKRSL